MFLVLYSHKHHFFLAIPLLPENLHLLGDDRVDGLSGIIGLNGKLAAETPVDEDAELNFFGAAKGQQGVKRRADGPASVQHIIDKHHVLVLDAEGNVGMVGNMQFFADIIAVKSDIELSVLNLCGRNKLADLPDHLVGNENTTGLNANNDRILQPDMIFQYLVTKPLDRNGQLLFVQNRFQEKKFA